MIAFILIGLAALAAIGVAVGVIDARNEGHWRREAARRHDRWLTLHGGGPATPPDEWDD